MFTKVLCVFNFLFLCCVQSYSQEIWSLEKCIEYALDNNIRIKQSQLNSNLSEIDLRQSKASLFPNVNANASQSYNFGRTIDPFTNQFATNSIRSNNFYVSSNVILFNGFQKMNTVKRNRLELEGSMYDTETMANDISLNIASAYLQVLFSKELVKVAENQLELTRLQVERTKTLVDVGTLAQSSLLEARAQYENDNLQLVNAKNNLELAYLNLVQLLDLDPTKPFKIVEPDLEIPAGTLLEKPETVYNIALYQQAEIKSAEVSVQSSDKGISIAKGSRSPSVSLSGNLGTGYSQLSKEPVGNPTVAGFEAVGFTSGGDSVFFPSIDQELRTIPFADQLDQNLNRTVGVYLSIPVFNGWQIKSSIEKAKIAKQNSEYNLALAKQNLYKKIYQAYADAKAALNRFNATRNSVDAFEESYKNTNKRYDVGLATSLELNEAKNRLVSAESDMLQAKYDYIFKTKVLDFYAGKPLKLGD